MVRYVEWETGKEKIYAAKMPIKICYGNIDNTVISKSVKSKPNSKYFIKIKFVEAIRPLVLIMAKISEYVKAFKVKEEDKDKNNKLMSFSINYKKLFEKFEFNWSKIEDF